MSPPARNAAAKGNDETLGAPDAGGVTVTESDERKVPRAEESADLPVAEIEEYGVEGWKERARQFGVSRHLIAGALHDVGGELVSRPEVERRLAEIAKREIGPSS